MRPPHTAAAPPLCLQATELSTGQLPDTEEVSKAVIAACTEFISVTAILQIQVSLNVLESQQLNTNNPLICTVPAGLEEA